MATGRTTILPARHSSSVVGLRAADRRRRARPAPAATRHRLRRPTPSTGTGRRTASVTRRGSAGRARCTAVSRTRASPAGVPPVSRSNQSTSDGCSASSATSTARRAATASAATASNVRVAPRTPWRWASHADTVATIAAQANQRDNGDAEGRARAADRRRRARQQPATAAACRGTLQIAARTKSGRIQDRPTSPVAVIASGSAAASGRFCVDRRVIVLQRLARRGPRCGSRESPGPRRRRR